MIWRADHSASSEIFAAGTRALLGLVVSLTAAMGAPTCVTHADETKGYLTPGAFDFRSILPPPPLFGSLQDQAELQIVARTAASASEERWRIAVADDASLHDRLEGAYDASLARKKVPRLRHLLDRAFQDMSAPIAAAKKHFGRPRPYQRHQFARACGDDKPRTPEPNPTKGSSYPSSHAAQSWAVTLILISVKPDRSDALFARAIEYGESRLVCGYHYPSDVEAGRLLATAIVAGLHASPDFRRDLSCAKAEYRALSAGTSVARLVGCG